MDCKRRESSSSETTSMKKVDTMPTLYTEEERESNFKEEADNLHAADHLSLSYTPFFTAADAAADINAGVGYHAAANWHSVTDTHAETNLLELQTIMQQPYLHVAAHIHAATNLHTSSRVPQPSAINQPTTYTLPTFFQEGAIPIPSTIAD